MNWKPEIKKLKTISWLLKTGGVMAIHKNPNAVMVLKLPNGLSCRIDAKNVGTLCGIFEHHCYDELSVFSPKKNDRVLDLGAHMGGYSLYAVTKIGKGRVLAVEPERRNYFFLRRNIQKNKLQNIVAIQAAISDFNGRVKLSLSKMNSGAHSILKENNTNYQTVDCFTLKHFLQHHNFKPTLIKCDVEGAELKILNDYLMKGLRNIRFVVETHSKDIAQKLVLRFHVCGFYVWQVPTADKDLPTIYARKL